MKILGPVMKFLGSRTTLLWGLFEDGSIVDTSLTLIKVKDFLKALKTADMLI